MENMASYILSVLKTQSFVFFSWGSHNFRTLPENKGLSFTVNGFLYKGEVKIVYNYASDTFTVCIGSNEIDDVYVDTLVETIDYYVEKNGSDESYANDIENWFTGDEYKEMFALYEE